MQENEGYEGYTNVYGEPVAPEEVKRIRQHIGELGQQFYRSAEEFKRQSECRDQAMRLLQATLDEAGKRGWGWPYLWPYLIRRRLREVEEQQQKVEKTMEEKHRKMLAAIGSLRDLELVREEAIREELNLCAEHIENDKAYQAGVRAEYGKVTKWLSQLTRRGRIQL